MRPFAKIEENVLRKSVQLITRVIICFSGTEMKKSRKLAHLLNEEVMYISYLQIEKACAYLNSRECIGARKRCRDARRGGCPITHRERSMSRFPS